jgi:hypothetical protein
MVFGVGLSKTGTHTLNACLELLGWRSIHYPDPKAMLDGRFAEALAGYNAATDISVSAFFRELDECYPGSLFVLTTRAVPAWIRSLEDHMRRREHELGRPDCPKAALRELVYGSAAFDRAGYIMALGRHVQQVRSHFRDRPGVLLEIDLCSGQGWERLCPFLGVTVPMAEVPWRNRTRAAS